MVIRDMSDSVELTLREMGPRGTPAEGDLCLRVGVQTPAFAGHVEEVWISRAEWGEFLAKLHDVERHRRGESAMNAMSPDEFRLAVFATDRAGHIAAEGWIGRAFPGRGGALRHRVSFSVGIEPDALPGLVAELESLALTSPDGG